MKLSLLTSNILGFILFSIAAYSQGSGIPCEDELDEVAFPQNAIGSQSSTFGNGLPSYFLDNIKTGSWASENVSRTNSEENPWIEIDLGQKYALQGVKVFYPSDLYPTGLENYYILTSRDSFASTDLSTELSNPEISYVHVDTVVPSGTLIPLDFTTARHIRIQYGGTGFLSFIEIDVPGTDTEVCNNGIDDDCDGKVDCDDSDCPPVLFNVSTINPACPICEDGEIHIQAFGDDIHYSVDGGNTFIVNCDEPNLCAIKGLNDGEYNIVITNDNGCTVEYTGNPVFLTSPTGIPQGGCLEPGCPNGCFEDGNFDGWSGATGSWLNGASENPGLDSDRHRITQSGFPSDPGGLDLLPSPTGGVYFGRLGNEIVAQTIGPDEESHQEQLTYCFNVTTDNADFYFNFALVLEDPRVGHLDAEKPFFQYRMYRNDTGDEILAPVKHIADIDDPFYEVVPAVPGVAAPIAYKGWTCEYVDLSNYLDINNPIEVCIEFITADCLQRGHFGYAYIDGLCSNYEDQLPQVELNINSVYCEYEESSIIATSENTVGENQFTWEVCKITSSGQICVTQDFL